MIIMQFYLGNALWDISKKEMDAGMKYNEEFVDRHFELIKIVLIILRSCRIFFIIMFLKYPQIMRWIIIYDSINRIIEAFIPVNYSLM